MQDLFFQVDEYSQQQKCLKEGKLKMVRSAIPTIAKIVSHSNTGSCDEVLIEVKESDIHYDPHEYN